MATYDPNEKSNQINDSTEYLLKKVSCLFPELSVRESETVYWLSIGYSNSQIADLMGVTENTTRHRIQQCREKLNVNSSHTLRAIYNARINSLLLQFSVQMSRVCSMHFG